MLPSCTSTAACRVRAWESLASSAARSTICSAKWLSWRFSGRRCGPGPGCMRTTPLQRKTQFSVNGQERCRAPRTVDKIG